MRTANNTNNYTVETLVAKYRNFVKDSIADWQWELNRRVEFNDYNPEEHHIICDDKGLFLKGHEHGDYSDYQRVLDFFTKNFPGCDSDKEFTEGLYDFCLNSDAKQIKSYMARFDAKCRADYQLISKLYQSVAQQEADAKVLQTMSKYFDSFFEDALTMEEFEFLCQHFTDVVSYEFEHENDWFQSMREKNYWWTGGRLSSWVVDYVPNLVTVKPNETVYAFNAGRGKIAESFPQSVVKGAGYGGVEGALGQIFLYSRTGGHSEIVPYKEFSMPQKNSVDVIIFDALEQINGYGALGWDLNNIFDSLKEGGKMIIFATRLGVLSFKEHRDELAKCWYGFLRRLIEEKAIESVISLENDLHSTKEIISRDKDDILLCIEKKEHQTVRFINNKTNKSTTISVDDLDSDILWPSHYLTERPENGRSLGSLVHNAADFKFGILNAMVKPQSDFDENVLIIEPTDLRETYDKSFLGNNLLQPMPQRRFLYYSLPNPCVYAYCTSEKLVVGYLDKNSRIQSLARGSISGFVPKRNIDPRYISALLLMPEVKQQILSICDGVVSALDFQTILDRIIVPKHSPKERLQFLAESNYEAWMSTQQELRKNHEDYKKAVRMRKHALTQSLSSIEAMFYALDAYRLRQNGNLSDADVISRRKSTTVKEAFEFIESNLQNMMVTLEHIADVEYSFDNPQMIDPERFIEAYVAQKESGWLNFKPIINWKKGNNRFGNDVRDPETGSIIAYKDDPVAVLFFSKDAFKRVLDNVVANAIAHGFTDSNRNDYKLRFSWYTDGMNLVVEVENNGTAIPADRDTASLLEYGVSGALHHDGHNGIGCNEIDDIMRRYDGSVEIVSTPNEEYTVKYILTFKSNSNSINALFFGL